MLLALVAMAGPLFACDLGGLTGGAEVPVVTIARPQDNAQVALGETVPVHASATDSTGVTTAELWVDGTLQISESSPVPEGQPSFSVVFRWKPVVQGSFRLIVKAYNASDKVGESAPLTVFVVPGEQGPVPTPPGPEPTEPGAVPTQTAVVPPPTPTQPGPPPATATAPLPPPTHTSVPPTNTPVPPTPTVPSGPCLPVKVTDIVVNGQPKGLAVHGDRLYVGIHNEPKVRVINTDNNTIVNSLDTGVPGIQQANGVVYHATSGKVYVANKTAGSVSALDPTGAASPIIITVGSEPFGLAAAGQYVYVANFASDRVGRINVATHSYQSLIDTYNKPCLLAAVGDDAIVPTNGAGRIFRVPPTGARIGIGDNKNGYFAVAVNPTSKRIFVTDRDGGDVLKIDGNTNTVEGTVHLPHRPYAVAMDPSKGRVYVIAAEANLLYVIKGPTLQIIGSVPVGGQGAAEGGQGIAVLGDRIYVSNYQGGTVTVLDDSACS